MAGKSSRPGGTGSSCPPAIGRPSARPGTWEAFTPANRAGARVRLAATSAPFAVPPTITPRLVDASEKGRIITPYDADAWEDALRHFGLFERHRDLPDRIRWGFPIGNMPPIFKTTIHPNYPPALKHMDFIKAYIDEQVSKGRMTGPYSAREVEHILGSPFISSPLSACASPRGAPEAIQSMLPAPAQFLLCGAEGTSEQCCLLHEMGQRFSGTGPAREASGADFARP